MRSRLHPLLITLLLAAPAAGQELLSVYGDHSLAKLGEAVAFAADLDGDGTADLLAGAPFDGTINSLAGRVLAWSGATGAVLHDIPGSGANEEFGFALAGLDDLDGDGCSEFVVGSPLASANGLFSGRATVFSGLTGAVLFTADGDSAGDRFGHAVAAAGDVNGDGTGDFVVGAYTADVNGVAGGIARVFSGATFAVLYTFSGNSAGDQLGWSVAGAGDVNGDGFADVIAGAPGDDLTGPGSGSALVFSGFDGSLLWTFSGDSSGDEFGSSVAGIGDVDGDARGDLLVGAPMDDPAGSASGSAWVFSGGVGSVVATIPGGSGNDRFGSAVAAPGDVDGDGIPDLLVGAFVSDENGPQAGSARVLSGADASELYLFLGDSPSDKLGSAVAGGTDVDGDGLPEILLGMPEDDDGAPAGGGIRMFAGGPPLVLSEPQPGTTGTTNTLTVTGAGAGNEVIFLARMAPGLTQVPCAGGEARVSIHNAKNLGSALADATGTAVFQRNVPARFSGVAFRIQAVEFETCRVSSLVRYTFP